MLPLFYFPSPLFGDIHEPMKPFAMTNTPNLPPSEA